MTLPGYGVPSPEAIHGTLRPRFRQIEQDCRDWCERPSRRHLRPLVNALGGMAVLCHLARQPAAGRRARRALQRLRGRQAGADRAVVMQCLAMPDGWAGRTWLEHECRPALEPLRATALGALRLPEPEGASLPEPVRRYLALRDCLGGGHCRVQSRALACRALLDDERERQAMPRRFALDMALSMDSPLLGLGSDGESPDRLRGALHVLYRELSVLAAAQWLRCVVLPDRAVRQARWLVVLHLRHHPGDWPADSRARLIRHLLVLQWQLMAEPEQASAPDLSDVLRATGRFVREWRQESGPDDEAAPWRDAALRQRIREELRDDLSTLRRELSGRGDRPVSPSLCTALARLHLTLHLTAYRRLAWWADSLQQSLLTRLQSGHPLGPQRRRRLLAFRRAVLAGPVQGGPVPGALMAAEHDREVLDAVVDEARLRSASRQTLARAVPVEPAEAGGRGPGGVREPALAGERTVIDQLSGGMIRLPDPAAWFGALEADGAAPVDLIRSVSQELAVLEKGARVLGVARIEALAAVLRSVYRQLGTAAGPRSPVAGPDRHLLMALRRGHAGLLHRLDQAAAWQSISRPQPVIEYLYRCLEARQSGRPANQLSLTQRCLSINRRLQALLDESPPASGTADRRTLMLTLMRDQARLLRTMAAPDRNRPGHGV